MKKIFLLSMSAFLFFAANLMAGKKYWVAASHATWNNGSNWASISGGTGGAGVPGSTDTAYFDGGGTANDTLDVNINVKYLNIAAGYTGKIVQGSFSVTVGTSGALLNGGTFSGGSGSITISGLLNISGCAFTSTSGTLSMTGNFTKGSGTFANNGGTFKLNGNGTRSHSGSVTFNILEITCTANSTTVNINSGTTFTTDDLKITGSNQFTLTGTGHIDVTGDLYALNTYLNFSSATRITFNGSGNQHYYGNSTWNSFCYPDIVVNKSSSDTLHLHDYVNLSGDFTVTSGKIDPDSSIVIVTQSATISGTFPLFRLHFSQAHGTNTVHTLTGSSITVRNLLSFQHHASTGYLKLNGGTIHAEGDVSTDNTANTNTLTTGTATVISIDGTGSQTFTGSNTAGAGFFPSITISKSSGTLSLVNTITVGGHWTYTAGSISAGSSTVYFSGTKRISGTHALNSALFAGPSASTYTIPVGSVLTLNGNMECNGAGAVAIDSGQIYLKGNLTTTNANTATGGNGTIVLNGTTNQTLTGSGTAGTGKLPNVTIDKASDTLKLSNVISCTGHWIYTRGIVNPTSSSVVFFGTFNVDGQGTSGGTMQFYRVQVATGTRTLTGDLYCRENFVFTTGTTISAGVYDITVGGNWNGQGTWSHGNDTVIFVGNRYNRIQGPGGGGLVNFAHLIIDRSGGSLTCINPVTIDSSMDLNLGRFKTTATNFLLFKRDATCVVNNNDSAYVHGPMIKSGNHAFTFPCGDTTLHDSIAYHPLAMTAPALASDSFRVVFSATAQGYGSAKAATLNSVSAVQYWTMERLGATASTPSVTLYWNGNGDNTAFAEMRVAEWTGSQWTDRGQGSVSITHPTGSLSASSALSFSANPAPLVIANAVVSKSYAVLQKSEPASGYHTTDGNVLYFGFEDEYDDSNDSLSFRVVKLSDDRTVALLATPANAPLIQYGSNAYKLDLYDSGNSPLASGYYMLEVTNERNEKWYVRFRI